MRYSQEVFDDMSVLPDTPNRTSSKKSTGFLPGTISAKGKAAGNALFMRSALAGEWAQEDEFHSQRLKLIGRMVARVAHEVKNPVASIQLNLEMIESELEHIPNEQSRQEASELLRAVKRELDRLETVTRACLQFITIPRLQVRKHSLHHMLKRLQEFLIKEMRAREVEFVNDFSPDVPLVSFDEDRLEEAVLNLYKNAGDAMPDGGTIRTSTRVCGEWVEIRVSDTGPGIAEEYAERLFEAFVSSKSRGTGLGLTIARDILMAHGGTIALEPDGHEETTFILRLLIDG
jgi:signal transduction histidine kinase